MIGEGLLGDPDHSGWGPELMLDQCLDQVVDRIDAVLDAMRLEPIEPIGLGRSFRRDLRRNEVKESLRLARPVLRRRAPRRIGALVTFGDSTRRSRLPL